LTALTGSLADTAGSRQSGASWASQAACRIACGTLLGADNALTSTGIGPINTYRTTQRIRSTDQAVAEQIETADAGICGRVVG
jgi:hypothetical protein